MSEDVWLCWKYCVTEGSTKADELRALITAAKRRSAQNIQTSNN